MEKKHIGYIANGINLDQIPSGNAWYIIKILNLQGGANQTGVGLNLPSKKLGLKDLIKIEDRILTQDEIDAISLFCVGACLSEIRNFEVVKKTVIELPRVINSIIVCPNSRCVSALTPSKFISHKNRQGAIDLTCHYCEQVFALSEIDNYKI
jgi:aspartate carbamoyltransferase regulatory subunit